MSAVSTGGAGIRCSSPRPGRMGVTANLADGLSALDLRAADRPRPARSRFDRRRVSTCL